MSKERKTINEKNSVTGQPELDNPKLENAYHPVNKEVFFESKGGATCSVSGELGKPYTNPVSGITYLTVLRIDSNTGRWSVFKIDQSKVKHTQPAELK